MMTRFLLIYLLLVSLTSKAQTKLDSTKISFGISADLMTTPYIIGESNWYYGIYVQPMFYAQYKKLRISVGHSFNFHSLSYKHEFTPCLKLSYSLHTFKKRSGIAIYLMNTLINGHTIQEVVRGDTNHFKHVGLVSNKFKEFRVEGGLTHTLNLRKKMFLESSAGAQFVFYSEHISLNVPTYPSLNKVSNYHFRYFLPLVRFSLGYRF